MRIRAYLLLMAVAILLPVIAFSAVALRMLQDAELAAALRGLHESANGVSLLLDRELYSAEAALQVLAASPSLATGDLKAFHEQAKMADRGSDGWTVLTDRNGQQVVNTLRPFGSKLPPPFEQDLVQQILSSGKTYVSNVRPGPVSKRMVTTLSIPVHLAGGNSYVLNEAFNTDHFKRLINSVRVPDGWIVGIIDGDGRLVARTLNSEETVGKPARPELVAAARQAPTGQIRHRTLEGTEVYAAFTHSSLAGWTTAVAAPVDLIEIPARRAALVAALGMLAAISCAAGIAFWFSNKHVKAIERAARAAVGLGNGQPPEPARSSVVEVNELHTALHTAGIQLLQAQEYRKQSETERHSLLLREQNARQMAEQQNKAKDQFLAMLGHELRNPLAPISTAAQMLKLPGLDEKRVIYTSDVISRQVEHMNSLLQDLLDVSRVTRGLVNLSMEPVETSAIVSGAVEQVRGLIESKRHQLELHVPSEPAWVNGDKTRLIQILINLLNNAAKYTPDGGIIDLQVEAERDWVVLSVRDNGMGITQDLLPRVFELFSQGERTPDRSQGGLGLGLALVKSLTELHGGSVTARSEGAGKGSAFTVRLPRIGEPGQQVKAVRSIPQSSCRSLRVMIVDDNVDAAQTLARYLSEAGAHRVSVYYDGKKALDHATHDAPDVFILDIGLPDIDGYELARRLRLMRQTTDTLLIALTGYGQAEDVKRAKAAGFNHHVPKPAEPKRILDMLAGLQPSP